MIIRRGVWCLMLVWLLSVAAASAAAAPEDPGEGEDRCAAGLRVDTFAGPEADAPEPGYADGSWSTARFSAPSYVLSYRGLNDDPDGWLLVSDTGNHVIRLVIDGLEVVTLAGTPKAADFRDGYRTEAQFNRPAGLAVDTTGNLYIADSGNRAIRQIDPQGGVTTLAGGPYKGTFTKPQALAYRSVAERPGLLIADIDGHCIRALDLSDPTYPVAPLAGACGEAGAADGDGLAARFTAPRSISWGADALGNEFAAVVDEVGLRLLRFQAGSGVTVTTLPAGAGAYSVYMDFYNNLFLTKPNSNRIEGIHYREDSGRFDNQSTLLAGDRAGCGKDEPFDTPLGVSAYFGNLVVADTNRHALRVLYDPLAQDPEQGRFRGLRMQCVNCGPQGW